MSDFEPYPTIPPCYSTVPENADVVEKLIQIDAQIKKEEQDSYQRSVDKCVKENVVLKIPNDGWVDRENSEFRITFQPKYTTGLRPKTGDLIEIGGQKAFITKVYSYCERPKREFDYIYSFEYKGVEGEKAVKKRKVSFLENIFIVFFFSMFVWVGLYALSNI